MLTLPSSPPCAAAVAALEAARVTSSSPALRKLDRAVSTPAPAERVPGDPEMDDSPAAAWYRQRKLKKVRKKKKKKRKKERKRCVVPRGRERTVWEPATAPRHRVE
jgi:hypothetical protein